MRDCLQLVNFALWFCFVLIDFEREKMRIVYRIYLMIWPCSDTYFTFAGCLAMGVQSHNRFCDLHFVVSFGLMRKFQLNLCPYMCRFSLKSYQLFEKHGIYIPSTRSADRINVILFHLKFKTISRNLVEKRQFWENFQILHLDFVLFF